MERGEGSSRCGLVCASTPPPALSSVLALLSSYTENSLLNGFISITTKAGIRYEGFVNMDGLDLVSGTVALQRVRHFGTEGRGEGGLAIPPSGGVFSRILFRASEIKAVQDMASAVAPIESLVQNDHSIVKASLGMDL